MLKFNTDNEQYAQESVYKSFLLGSAPFITTTKVPLSKAAPKCVCGNFQVRNEVSKDHLYSVNLSWIKKTQLFTVCMNFHTFFLLSFTGTSAVRFLLPKDYKNVSQPCPAVVQL